MTCLFFYKINIIGNTYGLCSDSVDFIVIFLRLCFIVFVIAKRLGVYFTNNNLDRILLILRNVIQLILNDYTFLLMTCKKLKVILFIAHIVQICNHEKARSPGSLKNWSKSKIMFYSFNKRYRKLLELVIQRKNIIFKN